MQAVQVFVSNLLLCSSTNNGLTTETTTLIIDNTVCTRAAAVVDTSTEDGILREGGRATCQWEALAKIKRF